MKKTKDDKTYTIIGATIMGILAIVFTIIFFVIQFSSSSTTTSSNSESKNRCGDTTSEHFAKTRKCNAKDDEKQNCTYSNCQCICKPRYLEDK